MVTLKTEVTQWSKKIMKEKKIPTGFCVQKHRRVLLQHFSTGLWPWLHPITTLYPPPSLPYNHKARMPTVNMNFNTVFFHEKLTTCYRNLIWDLRHTSYKMIWKQLFVFWIVLDFKWNSIKPFWSCLMRVMLIWSMKSIHSRVTTFAPRTLSTRI